MVIGLILQTETRTQSRHAWRWRKHE